MIMNIRNGLGALVLAFGISMGLDGCISVSTCPNPSYTSFIIPLHKPIDYTTRIKKKIESYEATHPNVDLIPVTSKGKLTEYKIAAKDPCKEYIADTAEIDQLFE